MDSLRNVYVMRIVFYFLGTRLRFIRSFCGVRSSDEIMTRTVEAALITYLNCFFFAVILKRGHQIKKKQSLLYCHCNSFLPHHVSWTWFVFATDPAKFLESTEADVTATLSSSPMSKCLFNEISIGLKRVTTCKPIFRRRCPCWLKISTNLSLAW